MASMQKSHEERAQSEAQKAADELAGARQDRQEAASPRGGGIPSSVIGTVKDTFSGSGGRDDTTATAGEHAEEGKAKAEGVADTVMDKAAETKDAAAEKARCAMDAAADKARGVRDAAEDRARGARDAAEEKAEGTKEYAAEKTAGAEEEEDAMLRVKAADHMTGQAFNDVGPIGEEGTGMPWQRR